MSWGEGVPLGISLGQICTDQTRQCGDSGAHSGGDALVVLTHRLGAGGGSSSSPGVV